jgi:hypothetical protein
MIEQLATWYLRRQGKLVLSPFLGFALSGPFTACRSKTDSGNEEWVLYVAPGMQTIAMNGATIMK